MRIVMIHCFIGVLAFLPGLVPEGRAQSVKMPLPLSIRTPVVDEFSQPLSGADGDLVHVLAYGAGIQPPNPFSGEPHPDNAVLFTSRIGAGMIRTTQRDGRFSTAIIPRPDQPFFVRVYNAPSTAEASFYEDSDIYAPHLLYDTSFEPQLTATTNPINSAIGVDGLSVSLKESLGLNPYTSDSDGDGITDRDELVVGTNPADGQDVLPPVYMESMADGRMTARMHTSPPSHEMMQMLNANMPTESSMRETYGHVFFTVLGADSLHGEWTPIHHGQVGSAWPPAVTPPPYLQTSGYYRLRMQP